MSKRPSQLSPDDAAELRKLYAAFRSLLERYGNTGEALENLSVRQELLEIAVRESSEDEANAINKLRAQVKRLEELELLRQMGADSSKKAQGHRSDIQDDHSIEHLQEMHTTISGNLRKAERRAARYGINVPTELENEIENYQTALLRLEKELDQLKKYHKESDD